MEDTLRLSDTVGKADLDKLAELSKLAIGGRSLREFAKLCDLSEGFLSRLTSGKLNGVPTRRSLAKITSAESKPQNGITFGDLMRASGYKYIEPEAVKKSKEKLDSSTSLPAKAESISFPPYLVTSVLESTGQLGPSYEVSTMRDLFRIKPRLDKDIVCIVAFCTKEEVDKAIDQARWNLMVAFCTYSERREELFFAILTNQPEFYKEFDADPIYGTGGELYIVLTEDYQTFSRQRPVHTVNNDALDSGVKDEATYDLTNSAKNVIGLKKEINCVTT